MAESQKRASDKLIQVVVVGGAAAAAAHAVGAPPAVQATAGAAAASSAASDLVSSVWMSLRERWNRNGEVALETGVEEAGMDVDRLLSELMSTSARQELLAEALEGAAHATLEAKIKALGRSLGLGALATDDDAVDRERHFVRAMADFERPHVRLLDYICERQASLDAVAPPSTQELAELAWVGRALFPLLATLERHGAIYSVGSASLYQTAPDAAAGGVFLDLGTTAGSPGRWMASHFGFECLWRLQEAGLDSQENEGM
jgi:hypothetical protein